MNASASPAGADRVPPEVVSLGGDEPRRGLRRRVRELLEAGQLVALPTETVFGLAARADRAEALERLAAAKGATVRAGWTWHVDRREALEVFDVLAPLARRLAERYWPGPLTLVLRGTPPGLEEAVHRGELGVRMPAHSGTRRFLADLDFPVVMSSANAAGAPPLTSAGEVAEAFAGKVALVVDGGSAPLGESSAVLRVVPGAFEVLRPGLLSIEELRRAAGRRILFVCTGNTCRSPMTAALATDQLARRLGGDEPADLAAFGFHVASAGVAAGPGMPASDHAIDAMRARGLDLGGHRSHAAVPEELAAFDEIYGLTAAHVERLRSLATPRIAKRIRLLDPEGNDVPDPVGGSRDDYERCADHILASIRARAGSWA